MSNILLSPTPLEISPAAEKAQMLELAEQNDVSLHELQRRKANIERKRQDLAVDSKEKNLEAVEKINRNIDALVQLISDPIMAAQIAGKIETGKDYNEFIKGVTSLAKLRDDFLDKAFDTSAQTSRKKKIEVAFASQGVQVAMRVETDE